MCWRSWKTFNKIIMTQKGFVVLILYLFPIGCTDKFIMQAWRNSEKREHATHERPVYINITLKQHHQGGLRLHEVLQV